MLEGCAQPTLSPNTNAATARVLARLGISVMPANEAGCCGAVDYHLNAQEKGLARARNNIDAWWPAIEAGVEAIFANRQRLWRVRQRVWADAEKRCVVCR
ncbi:Glycolate dehydrogenase, iron-sulfur subunit GlcF [Escherichia coli ISC41]|nr:Glycolate dehydrogenase, iron-sulfur subunit GlcF [Escherichia coli ISC41]